MTKQPTSREIKKELIKGIINHCRDWNGGAGLIVPQAIGKFLKKMGIIDGYSVVKNVPETPSLIKKGKKNGNL